jgi:hypothetical protein
MDIPASGPSGLKLVSFFVCSQEYCKPDTSGNHINTVSSVQEQVSRDHLSLILLLLKKVHLNNLVPLHMELMQKFMCVEKRIPMHED